MQQLLSGGSAPVRERGALPGWRQLARQLFEASPAIEDVADRQHAQLLAAILVVLILLGFTSGMLQWLFIPGFGPKFAAMLIALGALAGAFALSRTRHFRKAALVACVAPVVACVAITAADPNDRISGAFALIGVLFASLFLGIRSAALLALGAFVALAAALAPWHAPFDVQRALPLLAFQAILSPLLILAAQHRDRIEALRREQFRRQQAELHEARQMEWLGRSTGGIAHDFNNLLTVVLGNAAILSKSGDPEVQTITADISTAVERGAGLTRQLLATARKRRVQPSRVNVSALIEGLQGLLRRLLGGHIRLLVELDPDLPFTVADPSQVEQVLFNLVFNARDAMPSGGTLSIHVARAGTDDSWITLSVADTGSGMAEETLPHIFEPFFTTKGERGNGLGLATVRGIVEQSGGRIEVRSVRDQGSRFTVYLPAVRDAAQLGNPQSRRAGRSSQTSTRSTPDSA